MSYPRTLQNFMALAALSAAMLSCQPRSEEEENKASTHPKLEKQLARKDVKMPVTGEGNADLYQRYRITMEQYHTSGEHDVHDMYSGRMAPLDVKSHPDARTHRIVLTEALQEGVNFAGKYTIVSVECGANCQTHYVIDRQSGKVLDKLQGHGSASYSPNSRLFVLDAPDSTVNFSTCPDCQPKAYTFREGHFIPLQTETP
ncbi:hypothetical protein MKJ04_19705 [Pontibacter sp. E15-1]|uniref:hypothetical protein n=1 Tax=Pontibacter sp. E15-1 TaxID=2919918 RepID=UPI001F4F265E|nr:hypothetical protein [Pontibacter sp. E15-1]MCJ8167078.1 hypothetical protein [Pontibacter sp. E15-1]